jgi:hypothetical protein
MSSDRFTLDIPDPDEFEVPREPIYLPVDAGTVTYLANLLVCLIEQRRGEEEWVSYDEVWDEIVPAAAQALSSLVRAEGAYYRRGGARELVDQIAWFCHWPEARSRLGALTSAQATAFPAQETGLQDADVVAALLSLHELSRRRLAERKQQRAAAQHKQPPATAEQEPAAQTDVGWDF